MELLDKILNQENLNKAYKKVVSNKGVAGVDGITVKEVAEYIKEHKEEIISKIEERKYKPQPVKRVQIPKENGKMRNLGIPTVIDRIIQQAMVQVLSPIFEEQFNDNSFGFRPGKSCEQAVLKALEYLNDGYDWIVDIDLEKFFDTVNQDRLITIIRKTIKDGDVVSLISKYLKAGVMDKGVIKPTKVGTPQGGNLSPLLSNIMLNELDKELTARGLNFVRYADDCIILVKSEKAANRVLNSITKFIEKKLGLKVNAEKSKVTRPTQTKYLGFSFWATKGGKWKPKPHIKSYQKLKRKLKQLTDRSLSISLDNRIKQINYVVRGWVNYFRIANMKGKITEIDEHLRTRLRVIIWKQWKKITRKEKALMQLGVEPKLAHSIASSRKGYQLICKTDWLKFAINIEGLRKRGLVFLLDQYTKVHIECTD
ncbi:MAG: group II intron reverse transcriptase/maturase [Clostridia bacterium]|nr:group II intron reverse transcriptase/maturase [Clostridia bacterium]